MNGNSHKPSFFNEFSGKYKLVLITNNTETLIYEFLVKQITSENDNLITNTNVNHSNGTNNVISKLSPLKQIAMVLLPKDIVCKGNYQLIFKITNNDTACVTVATAEKLRERGWVLQM